jgi:hypothetical protein
MNLEAYKNLTQAEKMFFLDNYMLLGPAKFAKKFNKRFGRQFTAKYITVIAWRLGVSGGGLEGHYTVSDICLLLDKPESTVKRWLQTKMFKAIKSGHVWYVPDDEFEKMRVWCGADMTFPWPAITTMEASEILGISQSRICGHAQAGKVDSVKVGKNRFVRKSHIDAAAAWMTKKGTIKVPWSKLRRFIEEGKV